jgi:NADH:ubiquinone oxidoreductase subunit 6 (subunit J)
MDAAVGVFYTLSFVVVAFAAGILFTDNLLHAAFFLMAALIGVSGIFVFAGADFLAVTQIMIYIGGILVLILFGIMMTKNETGSGSKSDRFPWRSLLIGTGLFSLLLGFIKKLQISNAPWILHAEQEGSYIKHSTIQTLGVQLMTEYLFPFEIMGILLLMALVGSAFVAGKGR